MFLLLLTSIAFITENIVPFLPAEGALHSIESVLGGGTNENFHLTLGKEHYFVRFGNEQAQQLGASLENEVVCTQMAHDAGLAPPIWLYLPAKKALVSSFIAATQKINLRDETTLLRLTEQIKILHNHPVPFPKTIDPYTVIKSYHALALRKGIPISKRYLNIALAICNKLPTRRAVPCHLDLHTGNLLDDGERLWLIDWEYSAMADPLFDLAVLSATEHFSDHEMERLLKCYGLETLQEGKWLVYYRILADLRWGYWCLIQEHESDLDYPYREEGEKFFSDALKRFQQYY